MPSRRPADLGAAFAAALARVDEIEAAVGDRFPLYATAAGAWTTSRRGSWTSGFWVGMLWIRAAATGSRTHRDAARRWTRPLAERIDDDTITRAMIFWHGAAAGATLCGDADAAQVALAGARAVRDSFDPGWGLIPVGTAFTADPRPTVGIDALAAVVALLTWAQRQGLPGGEAVAHAHAEATLRLLLADDGRVTPTVALPAGHPAGTTAAGQVWARGQAWAVLGSAAAARVWPDFTHRARVAGQWWERHYRTDTPPPDQFDDLPPESAAALADGSRRVVDTSAAVIAAAGLWTLADTRGAANGRPLAVERVAGLLDRHMQGGGLQDGCYDLDRGVACAHELIWGDYFLLALLARLTGAVPVELW